MDRRDTVTARILALLGDGRTRTTTEITRTLFGETRRVETVSSLCSRMWNDGKLGKVKGFGPRLGNGYFLMEARRG